MDGISPGSLEASITGVNCIALLEGIHIEGFCHSVHLHDDCIFSNTDGNIFHCMHLPCPGGRGHLW